jgi:MoaA/NifB/PqqE/SkfB family radical SAM enzyme
MTTTTPPPTTTGSAPTSSTTSVAAPMRRLNREEARQRLADLAEIEPDLAARVARLRDFGHKVRNTEIHLTNACNLRCKGCWFFEYGFDEMTSDERDLARLRTFIDDLRQRGLTSALLIGGEPTLVPARIQVFVEMLDFVTISTNGLRCFPRGGFENVAVAVSLFGGGPLDDELRGIRPNGSRFTGLFDKALANYREDDRATFVYALTEPGIDHIDATVRRIAENGNQVTFNFYSAYGSDDPLHVDDTRRLLEEALRVATAYPEAVVSHPYYIEAMITGRTHFGSFGYDVCPSISVDHPAHAQRVANGNPVLPGFSVWGADLETLQFCCTSGHCGDCRDSQAVFSWLLVSMRHFLNDLDGLRTWVELAESYWRQWCWAPYHPRHIAGPVPSAASSIRS